MIFSDGFESQPNTCIATPESHGAVGDGITDDTAAVQAAVDSGREVRLSAKTYRITSAISTEANNLVIRGSGTNKSVIFADSTDGLDVTQSDKYGSMILSDFTMVTNARAFTAVRYTNTDSRTGDMTGKIVDNVNFFGQHRFNNTRPLVNAWNTCLDIVDGDMFEIDRCHFQGAEEDRPFTQNPPEATFAIKIRDTTKITVANSKIVIFGYGIHASGQCEEVNASFTTFLACGYGVYGINLVRPSNYWVVSNCHLSSYIGNINIGEGRSPHTQLHSITGCSMFKRPDSTFSPFRQVRLRSSNSLISGNTFRYRLANNPTGDRVIVLGQGSSSVLITENICINQDAILFLGGNTRRIGAFNNVIDDAGKNFGQIVRAPRAGDSYTAVNNIGDRVDW